MKKGNIKNPTKYPNINRVLIAFLDKIQKILKNNLVGIYLTGSLTYDDFVPTRSDIDLLVVAKKEIVKEKLAEVERMHLQIEKENPKWAKRIECSYVPLAMLENILPPKTPRPYFGEGIFYPKAPYGNEWLINQYFLYKYGLSLTGPDFRTLVKPIDARDVKAAVFRDLYKEWQPKINDPKYLKNNHYQSYVVLNLCRILYTLSAGKLASKKTSTAWVKNRFGKQWKNLIEEAESWQYGRKMNSREKTIDFIKFVLTRATLH